MVNKKINSDHISYDPIEEYFKDKLKTIEEDEDIYFSIKESKPPHY